MALPPFGLNFTFYPSQICSTLLLACQRHLSRLIVPKSSSPISNIKSINIYLFVRSLDRIKIENIAAANKQTHITAKNIVIYTAHTHTTEDD